MVVKTRKFRFFSARGGIPYLDFDYFCKTIPRERNGFYRRDAARHVSTQNENNTINH